MKSYLHLLDKTNIIIPTLTAGAQLYTRSVGVAYFILGALSCSISVKLLKSVLRQPRPIGKSRKVTYGMPSTHAATISYYATFICAACTSLPIHDSLQSLEQGDVIRLTTLSPVIVVPWALLIVLSRIWLEHHTFNQVAVGSAYGVLFAGLWFVLWTRGGWNVLIGHMAHESEMWVASIMT